MGGFLDVLKAQYLWRGQVYMADQVDELRRRCGHLSEADSLRVDRYVQGTNDLRKNERRRGISGIREPTNRMLELVGVTTFEVVRERAGGSG